MCLDKITKRYPKGISGCGWKVFKRSYDGKDLLPDLWGDTIYKVNRWYEARKKMIDENWQRYSAGFHIFLTKKGAKDWVNEWHSEKSRKNKVIRKVRFRNGHTKGSQELQSYPFNIEHQIIVAREMMIIRRRDE